MASVYTCDGTTGVQQQLNGDYVPTCSGNGGWVDVQFYVAETFDVSTLDSETLATAFSAGFVSLGVGLVIVWAARIVLRSVLNS